MVVDGWVGGVGGRGWYSLYFLNYFLIINAHFICKDFMINILCKNRGITCCTTRFYRQCSHPPNPNNIIIIIQYNKYILKYLKTLYNRKQKSTIITPSKKITFQSPPPPRATTSSPSSSPTRSLFTRRTRIGTNLRGKGIRISISIARASKETSF